MTFRLFCFITDITLTEYSFDSVKLSKLPKKDDSYSFNARINRRITRTIRTKSISGCPYLQTVNVFRTEYVD